jgi:hypothetical protein
MILKSYFWQVLKKIWKRGDPSEATITTKIHENCKLGFIKVCS